MARKRGEDWSDRFSRRMEKFADDMANWAENLSDKLGAEGGYSVSQIQQNGKKIVVKSTDKKITITVDGKEVYKEEK